MLMHLQGSVIAVVVDLAITITIQILIFNNSYNKKTCNCKNSQSLSDIDKNRVKNIDSNGNNVDCINLISDSNSDHDRSDGNHSDKVKNWKNNSKNVSNNIMILLYDNTKRNTISNAKNAKLKNNVGFESLQN